MHFILTYVNLKDFKYLIAINLIKTWGQILSKAFKIS